MCSKIKTKQKCLDNANKEENQKKETRNWVIKLD